MNDKNKKFFRGAALAVIAATITYGTENIGNVDFGEYTAFVVAAFAVLSNGVKLLIWPPK